MPSNDKLYHTMVWHFNSFSGTQLIFSRAGPSVAFLWVPFPLGILLTFGKENTFSLLSLNRKILSPPKEMEQNKYAISPVRSDYKSLCSQLLDCKSSRTGSIVQPLLILKNYFKTIPNNQMCAMKK